MAGDFKVRVGAEFDASGLEAEIRKHLKDQKIKVKFDLDDSSSSKASQKMRQNAKAVENEFKQALALQKQITSGQRQLSNNNLSKGMAGVLRKTIASERTELNKLYSEYGKKFSDSQHLALEKARGGTPSKQIGNTKDTYNQMLQIIRQIETESKNMLNNGANATQFSSAKNRLEELKSTYDAFRDSVNGQLNTSQLNKLDAAIQKTANNLDKIRAKFQDKIADGFATNQYQNMMDDLNKLYGNTSKTSSIEKFRTQLVDSYASLNKAFKTGDIDGQIESLQNFEKQYDRTMSAIKRQSKTDKEIFNNGLFDNKKTKFGYDIDKWMNRNTAAAKAFGDELNTIKAQIKDADGAQFVQLKSDFDVLKSKAESMGLATMTFGDRLKNQAREYASYLSIASVAMTGVQAFRAMAQNVLEVDTAMTGLYRVTDLTSHQYDQLYDNMIASSKQYGRTLTDTINATSDWVRAGFNSQDSLELAGITAMYQNVSDLDYSEASENLLTAYNGFKTSFQEDFGGDAVAAVGHIADAFNELDNQYSVTAAGVGEGLARSASALQLAGNTFEESAAMISGITEITQNPEKAGNAMKILSLRLRGMKGELEDLGENTEGVENISKMQGQILNMTRGAVNIFDANGDFKSTYDIMKEISQVYDDLSSTEQASLLETIAGKDRANDVAALLSNFETVIDMVDTAENSAGSAAEENARFVDSLQGRLNSLTSSFQVMSNSIADSDFLKGGLSAVEGVIQHAGGIQTP